jgi:competence protein ComEA
MSAVPVSLAARLSAWAKESLVARAIAIAAGLVVLAVIGGSALAGNAKTSSAAAAMTEPSAPVVVPVAPVAWVDAGGVAIASRPAGAVAVTAAPQLEPTENVTPTPQAGAGAKQRASPDDPVDLNAATANDLRRLPGVGAKRADAILALRARLPGARFRQIEDLLKVKGIGRAMLRRLHPLVRLSTQRADAGAASA